MRIKPIDLLMVIVAGLIAVFGVVFMAHSADTIYLLSGDAIVTDAEGNKSTVPAFMAESNLDVGYFQCGTYDGQYIYNVLCLSADCDKLRKSTYFLGNTEIEIAIKNLEIVKAFSNATYEVDEVDLATEAVIKVQKTIKYVEWEKKKPGTLKRIDKPIEWQ